MTDVSHLPSRRAVLRGAAATTAYAATHRPAVSLFGALNEQSAVRTFTVGDTRLTYVVDGAMDLDTAAGATDPLNADHSWSVSACTGTTTRGRWPTRFRRRRSSDMADLNVLIAFDAATIAEQNPGASRNPDAPTHVDHDLIYMTTATTTSWAPRAPN